MPATVDLVERSGDLKRDLLTFARGPRFGRTLQRALAERFGRGVVADEGGLFNFLDHFILQRRQPNGRTVVEHFVEEQPELPEAERAMLLGWREVVEGTFAVQGRAGVALLVENLIDELPLSRALEHGTQRLRPVSGGLIRDRPAGARGWRAADQRRDERLAGLAAG